LLKSITRFLPVALLCLSLAAIAIPVFADTAPDDFKQVDDYVAESMRRLPIKGAALAIVKGDQILYLQGYGTANAQGDPATPQTPWPMASVTKSFTALAVHQLAVAGKVNLDAALQTYLPEFRLADQQAASSVTVRNLLDHTSGISTVEGDQPYVHSPQTTFERVLIQLARYRPGYPPGEHYAYSNLNYVLLGEVIARVSGQTYADYVQQHILAPLEMSNSTFADFHTIPHAATGNLITYGMSVPYDEPYVPVMLSAGYLTSTAEDMAHYLSLIFGRGQYKGLSLLPASQQGWYDPWWNWNAGWPAPDLAYGFSGGHNSISTSCLLFPLQKVGVVLLLNTRLDQVTPAVSSFDLALGIGNIILHNPYEVPSNRGFYTAWGLIDGLFILLLASLIWQASRLKNWSNHYQVSRRSNKALAWVVIVLDLLICIGILIFPVLTNTRWNSVITFRPDFGIPLFLVAAGLGMIGLVKIGLTMRQILISKRG
jgi:CubicO group peptidase (beta-lactamase class C family)